MEKRRDTILDRLNAALVLRVVIFVYFAALFVVVGVVGVYFLWFSGPLSTTQSVWGEFGDFVGGTLNPLISFFALLALLITIVLQSKELEETRKQLERAATAQEKSEDAMRENVKLAEDTAKRQLRAYVTVDADSPHFGTGGLRIRIRNHGDTPAKNTCIWTSIVREIPDGFGYPDKFPPILVGYLVAPKQHCAAIVQPRMEAEFTETFFLYGHIDYTDIFGDRWRVDFCHEHQISGGFFPHPKHNDENGLGRDSQE